MSAIGPKRTSLVAPHMSAFGGKADMEITTYSTFGKSGKRAPHGSFILPARFVGGEFVEPIDQLGVARPARFDAQKFEMAYNYMPSWRWSWCDD